jgi:hypothetical protein
MQTQCNTFMWDQHGLSRADHHSETRTLESVTSGQSSYLGPYTNLIFPARLGFPFSAARFCEGAHGPAH